MAFKDNLKILREHKGITKTEMAKRLGIPYPSYQNYENTKQEPRYILLKKMSEILGVTIDVLLAEELPNVPSKNILSMRELPPNESIKFTPYFVFNSSENIEVWKKLWLCIENEKLEECHYKALEKAQRMYYDFLIAYLDNCITFGKPQSDFTLRQATADDPKESE